MLIMALFSSIMQLAGQTKWVALVRRVTRFGSLRRKSSTQHCVH